ncbi:MAG: HAD family hydrolase, partial [Deltaproteobacteria bacterium]|nr:HAD family hydrolase [Deltaproteobacteria bacterium]
YIESSGRPFCDQLEVLFPEHQANTRAALEFEDQKKRTYFHSPLFTGTSQALVWLHQRRLKSVVSSNNSQALVDAYVEQASIAFDLVLGWRPNFSKGEDHFRCIEQTFDVDRSDMVFVGDSLHDGDRALAAGIDFIAKVGTFTPEAFRDRLPGTQVITNLLELQALIP